MQERNLIISFDLLIIFQAGRKSPKLSSLKLIALIPTANWFPTPMSPFGRRILFLRPGKIFFHLKVCSLSLGFYWSPWNINLYLCLYFPLPDSESKCFFVKNRNMHTVMVLCDLVTVDCTHILWGCFTGSGAIIGLPQCQWNKPKGNA